MEVVFNSNVVLTRVSIKSQEVDGTGLPLPSSSSPDFRQFGCIIIVKWATTDVLFVHLRRFGGFSHFVLRWRLSDSAFCWAS